MLFFLLIAAALARVPLEDVLSGEAESDLSTMLNSLLRQDVEAEMSDSMEDDSAEAFDNEDDSAEAFDEDESSDPEDELSAELTFTYSRVGNCAIRLKTIGKPKSLEEAQKLFVASRECAVEGATLQYSGYSYDWGAHCCAPGSPIDSNKNWKQYSAARKFSCGMVKDRLSGCSSGERKITYKEMGMCKDHLCNNLISTWAIVNVDGGHMDGKGYGCKYDTNVRRTGHELCVADTSSGSCDFVPVAKNECPSDNGRSLSTCVASRMRNGQLCESDSGDEVNAPHKNNCGPYDVYRYECDSGSTLPECPAGYTQVGTLTTKNDVAGGGLGQVRMAKIEDCKAKCDRDSRCKSFGFGHHNSKTYTECEIDGVDTPNQSWSPHGPLRMCKKTCQKKYTKKWPHCENIDCNRRDFKSMVQVCAQNKDCNGFSYDGSWGCLKKNCVNNGKNGMGSGTHDYYECRSEGIAEEAALSFDADSDDNVEEQLLAKLLNRLAAEH